MSEWKLFDGDVPEVSTAEFHQHRERAPHLEQEYHRGRLETAARMILSCRGTSTFSDLGCGDGGLLSLVQGWFPQGAWGYDFQPSNLEGWLERGVVGTALDVFGADRDAVVLGSVVAMTEVLEHLADPHGVLRWLHDDPGVLAVVCSSPVNEGPGMHDECHAWAWDFGGYEAMFARAGWTVRDHVVTGNFQVIRAEK